MSSVHDSPVNAKPPTSPVPQFYRRPLPRECISFCSAEGKVHYVSYSIVSFAVFMSGYCTLHICRYCLIFTTYSFLSVKLIILYTHYIV